MDTKLHSYIREQLAAKISHTEIKKTLVDAGWNETEVTAAIIKEINAKRNKRLIYILGPLAGLVLLFLLIILTIQLYPKRTYRFSSWIPITNGYLELEIQSQEKVLHDVLHSDLEKGNIPISKELTILFKLTDLHRLQSLLLDVNDMIDNLEKSEIYEHNQAHIDQTISEIQDIQKSVSDELKDRTLKGTIDANWIINFATASGQNLLP